MKAFNTMPSYSCGIDTLYYFCESSFYYDDLFLDILDQIDSIKGRFDKKEIAYESSDIHITIQETTLYYLGKAEGYHWFKDINEFFKIGFKDPLTNRGLHDIRVQLLGSGIYTIGIKSIMEYIDQLLEGYITNVHPITRIDLNMFLQMDLGFIDKSMFVTRKRNYASISEIGDASSLQTLYVGKPPFMLRLYNKSLELKKSKKEDVMREYLQLQGFDLSKPLFNVEFEMHREHLKAFGIMSVEEALSQATALFQRALDDIRLIDLKTISEADIKNNTKHRAKSLPLWEFMKEAYTIDSFLQITAPLERIKRRATVYDEICFLKEYKTLLRKGLINNIALTKEFLNQGLEEAINELEKPPLYTGSKPSYYPENFTPLEIIHFSGVKEQFRLLSNGELIKPVNVLSVDKLSDQDLLNYLEDIVGDFHKEGIDFNITNKRYTIAYEEAVRRKLKPHIPF